MLSLDVIDLSVLMLKPIKRTTHIPNGLRHLHLLVEQVAQKEQIGHVVAFRYVTDLVQPVLRVAKEGVTTVPNSVNSADVPVTGNQCDRFRHSGIGFRLGLASWFRKTTLRLGSPVGRPVALANSRRLLWDSGI